MTAKANLTYRESGVDIDAGNRLVDLIKPAVAKTVRPGVMGSLGGFGGLFNLDLTKFRDPVLVSGTDGVGTKLVLARELGFHHTIGIDLVAMCANDVLVQGAEPLFFLDYFACGKLDTEVAADVVRGVAQGCLDSGCALLGGETAEMPDMYHDGEYDLAGFCVGAVDKSALIDGSLIQPGDVVIGIASSGPHSNGYSLIRRIVERADADLSSEFSGSTLGEALIQPTTLYARPVLKLLEHNEVHGMAHITGGGLVENTERVLPKGLGLKVDFSSWPRPEVFSWLAEHGPVAESEMQRVFNLGIGFVLIAPQSQVGGIQTALTEFDLASWPIGQVTDNE